MNRIFVFIVLWLIGMFGMPSGAQQRSLALFSPFNWEQASLQAAREHKLVLVEAGEACPGLERQLQKQPELMRYLKRNVVAVRMDMNTPQGQEFVSRLLLHPYPVFAFFMPYGDLVGTADPQAVRQNPEVLREAYEKARALAEIKKANSRTVSFVQADVAQALGQAAEEEKEVFVFLADEQNQASLLLERNVFTLNEVADFFNPYFVNLRLSGRQREAFRDKYGIGETAALVFLNAKGKILLTEKGAGDAAQLLACARNALEQAKGIPFRELSVDEALLLAREQGKLVFTDFYIPGAAHKQMAACLFTDPEVTAYFKEHFISRSSEAGQSCLTFTDASGRELHRILRVGTPEELREEAVKAVTGKGVADMRKRYQDGDREDGFLEEYIRMLGRAGLEKEADSVLQVYFGKKTPGVLKEAHYWKLLEHYGINLSPAFFDYILSHRHELYDLYGEKNVRQKIADLWIAGAENFVHEGIFDEAGFKAYGKRLKKEKVEGARLIIRNARMHAAEKVGDWKVFITLAEEKWNEEHIPDAELYAWGVKIREHCSDNGLRYKMAQWLADRAMELGRKERLSGKVKISSYRGFFEKLADDLLKN